MNLPLLIKNDLDRDFLPSNMVVYAVAVSSYWVAEVSVAADLSVDSYGSSVRLIQKVVR